MSSTWSLRCSLFFCSVANISLHHCSSSTYTQSNYISACPWAINKFQLLHVFSSSTTSVSFVLAPCLVLHFTVFTSPTFFGFIVQAEGFNLNFIDLFINYEDSPNEDIKRHQTMTETFLFITFCSLFYNSSRKKGFINVKDSTFRWIMMMMTMSVTANKFEKDFPKCRERWHNVHIMVSLQKQLFRCNPFHVLKQSRLKLDENWIWFGRRFFTNDDKSNCKIIKMNTL